MKKKVLFALLLMILLLITIECFNEKVWSNKKENNEKNIVKNGNNVNNESGSNDNMETITNIKVSINDKIYNVKLEENETAKSFIKLLPQEFKMSELNQNEKYAYIKDSLPTNAYNPKHIAAGDIMLYGDNCLVIFYKSFDTNYSYTKIGHIDNLEVLNDDNIIVAFSK